MIAVEAKKRKKALFGIVAYLILTTMPVPIVAGDQGIQYQRGTRIYNTSKQPDSNYGEHIRIQHDKSNHNYSILPHKGKIFQTREQEHQSNKRSSTRSR